MIYYLTNEVFNMETKKMTYFHCAVVFVLAFFFRFLPPVAQITPYGMGILGTFIGAIYGWMTIDMLWPSLMALAGAERIFNVLDEPVEADDGYVILVNVEEVNGELVESDKRTGRWAWKHTHQADGSVDYVELTTGEKLSAKWVISSLHPSVTFSLLENNTVYKKAFFTRINSLPNTYGLFTTYLLIKPNSIKYVPQNHYLFNNPDVWAVTGDYKGFNIPSTLLCMQPGHNSEYTNVITLLTPMPFSICEKWQQSSVGRRGEDYKAFKAMYSEAVIDFVCEYYPTLRQNIEKVYTASPLTYRDYTATPEGSAYGIVKDCRNPMVTLMPARTRIGNLLLTGQNINIHGCLGTVISSAVTSSEILGVEYLSKKIGNA